MTHVCDAVVCRGVRGELEEALAQLATAQRLAQDALQDKVQPHTSPHQKYNHHEFLYFEKTAPQRGLLT